MKFTKDTAWIIVQAVLTLGIWGAIIYMAIVAQEVPEILLAGGATILGFWFGSQVERRAVAIGGGSDDG